MAPKGAGSKFIDLIKNDAHSLSEDIGYQRNENGAILCAAVSSKCSGGCGWSAFGGEIRPMLRKGFEECVDSGKNDGGNDQFWAYLVENDWYITIETRTRNRVFIYTKAV